MTAWSLVLHVPLIRHFARETFSDLVQRVATLRGSRKLVQTPIARGAN